MSDRFKFRVWDKEEKRYMYKIDLLDLTSDTRDVFDSMYMNHEEGNGYLINENRILEQCTGLKDKNGNLIYEGDILELTRKRNYQKRGSKIIIGWEKYSSCGFSVCVNNNYSIIGALTEACGKICKIIGNIHENKDLLDD